MADVETDPLLTVVAKALRESGSTPLGGPCINTAQHVVAALREAGLTLPDGGRQVELFATFANQQTAKHAPWADRARWVTRNTAEAARHTARVWGGEAFAARCVQTWWPDGREYRTPWERLDG